MSDVIDPLYTKARDQAEKAIAERMYADFKAGVGIFDATSGPDLEGKVALLMRMVCVDIAAMQQELAELKKERQ